MKYLAMTLLFILSVSVHSPSYSHGLTSASAEVEVRPNNLIELRVQFDFVELLNHEAEKYSLPLLVSLPEQTFAIFYTEVISLFDRALIINNGADAVDLNRRYPSQQQMFALLKREFAQSQFASKQSIPYTFDERRFYQQFFFDFRVQSAEDIENLAISFPKELGNIYVTLSKSTNTEVHQGDTWSASI